jgi:ribulose-phosphate 3-epimerase
MFLAGRGGQKFLERCVPKVAELRNRFPKKDIEVDGGVGPKTVDAVALAGTSITCHLLRRP